MTTIINLYGAAHGIGTTTTAVLTAKALEGQALLFAASDAAWLGLDFTEHQFGNTLVTLGSADVLIFDRGIIPAMAHAGKRIIVTDDSFKSLHAIVALGEESASFDGAILIRRPGGVLRSAEVEHVLNGVPILAQLDHSPLIARWCDAGLVAHKHLVGLEILG